MPIRAFCHNSQTCEHLFIGEATALQLATEGAKVALIARRSDRLNNLARRIQTEGGEALSITADVADEAQIRDAIAKTHSTWGQVDVLVNNAGIMLLGLIDGANPED